MKYKVISYLHQSGIVHSPHDKIGYKLQKKGWFGIWRTVMVSFDKEKLDEYCAELNKNHKH
jgi:hypothetical protein